MSKHKARKRTNHCKSTCGVEEETAPVTNDVRNSLNCLLQNFVRANKQDMNVFNELPLSYYYDLQLNEGTGVNNTLLKHAVVTDI